MILNSTPVVSRCTVQDHMEASFMDMISNGTPVVSRCTVQDHVEASFMDEEREFLQSDKDEKWHVQDNLVKI